VSVARVAAALGLALVVQARAEPQTHAIIIEGMQFSPQTLTVRRGDRVVWQNKDLVPHTATAAGRFDSRTVDAGKSWTWVAGEPGTLPYVCTLHPTMKATLIVQ
jgi:plastocyanin